MFEKVKMSGEKKTTKCAKDAKMEAKKMFRQWVDFGHYPHLENKRFFVKALSRISRIS